MNKGKADANERIALYQRLDVHANVTYHECVTLAAYKYSFRCADVKMWESINVRKLDGARATEYGGGRSRWQLRYCRVLHTEYQKSLWKGGIRYRPNDGN